MGKSYAACKGCGSVNRYDIDRSASATCSKCKTPLPVHGAVVDVDGRCLKNLSAKSPLPVVVDFWASWCGPCLAFAPTFAAVASKLADRFVFAKANTEDHPEVANEHDIRGIPTLILFKGGTEVGRQSGALSAPALEQWLLSL